MALDIRVLSVVDEAAFHAAYAIYRDAIEPSEQKTLAEMKALLARADYLFLAAFDGDAMVGMAVSYAPPVEDFWLFEYAAVTPAGRGQGTGALLFRMSAALAGEDRVALVEADAALGPGAPDGALSIEERRLGFYARLGLRRLAGVDYKLPLETNGTPPPMVLLALAPPDRASIPMHNVERWLRAIYVEVYGQSPNDPRIADMLLRLGQDVALVKP